MPALSDPKLELFAQSLLRHIAQGMPRSKAAEAAGREAGYRGSSLGSNARKRAGRADVKARMIELAAPAQALVETEIAVDVARAKSRLSEIILANVAWDETVLPKDVINAVRQLAAIEGWNAPTKIDVNKHVHTDWSTEELVAFITDARASLERNGEPAGSETEPDRVH